MWFLGCGGEGAAPVPAGVAAIYDAPDKTALTPYPSDRYTVPDATTGTGLRVKIGATMDLVGLVPDTREELEEMDGFSTTGGVVVTFDGPVDVRRLALRPDPFGELGEQPPLEDAGFFTEPGSPLLLLDVDPDSPDQGQPVGLVNIYYEQAKDDFYVADELTLIAQPAVPLRPATRYLLVVTDALRAKDGGPVRRSALTEQLLSGAVGDDYSKEVDAALSSLEQAMGVQRSRVRLATTFTTASVHDGVNAMAAMVRAAPPPVLTEAFAVETPQQGSRVRFRATMASPEFRDPLPDGRWDFDAEGKPIVKETVGLEVFMAVSDAGASDKRVPVIYGHGLAGDKDGTWGTAERLADLNVAVFGIDSPHHGSRAEPGANATDAVFRFFGIDTADSSFLVGRARDNFRQMAADQLQLVKLIRSLDTLDVLPPGAPDGVPDLDTSRILYIGHSFGSVQGPTIFALAPEISHACWNVGGDGLMTLLRDSGLFGLLVNALKPPGTHEGAVSRFFAVAQAIVDPGDPLNFARYGTVEALDGVADWRARDVLLQEVIHDGIVPNSTSEALARAAGLQLVDAIVPISGVESVSAPAGGNLPSGATGVISQFDKIEGDKIATHGELIFAPEGRAQYLEFFKTGLNNPHATVPPPY